MGTALERFSVTDLDGGITRMGETPIVERNPSIGGLSLSSGAMELELTPAQPVEIAEALAALVLAPAATPDPWWKAGIDELLER